MKRMLLAGALILLCAEVAWVLWSQRKAAQLTPAQLVPPETLLLAECPNLSATAMRWKKTALHEILAEPEVRAFFSRPGGEKGKLGGVNWKQVRPRKAFLAIASFGEQPQAVAGLAFEGQRRELEPLIALAMIRAQNASPRGRMTRLHYRGFSITAFKDHGIEVAGCFARNWYFVANDLDLLKGTLDRYLRKTQTVLAFSSPYQASQLALPAQADFRLFFQPASSSTRLLAGAAALPAGVVLPRIQFETAALASRVEGRLIHDTLVLFQRASAERPKLNGHTLALTTPNTVFYGAVAPRWADWFSSSGKGVLPGGKEKLIPMLMAALNPGKPLRLSHFQAAFGPEHAFFLDWPQPSPQPSLFVVSEVRDPVQARQFADTLFRTWDRVDNGGVPIWRFSLAQPALFHPAVALSGSHLLAGLSSESLEPFALHAASSPRSRGTLERMPVFQASLAQLAKPETALVYLDSAAFFERLYELLQPAAILWGASQPWLSPYANFERFPSAQAITRHLSPISLTARQAKGGMVIDTMGPISFVEIGAGIGAAGFYVLWPSLRAKKPTSPGIAPPPPLKPLSQPQPGTP